MVRKRKAHPAAFRAQVALVAIKGDKADQELASLHGVHATMMSGSMPKASLCTMQALPALRAANNT